MLLPGSQLALRYKRGGSCLLLSDQAARQGVTMIKKTSGVFLLYLLRSTLCIPLNEFYSFGGNTPEFNQRLGDGNDAVSIEVSPNSFYWFYGQFQPALKVSSYTLIVSIPYCSCVL